MRNASVIHARNVNDAYHEARHFMQHQPEVDSRYGRVRRAPGAVITHYTHPAECVLFEPGRRANPFFHLFESLWLLAGRNDVAFVQHFAKRMGEFSDDGVTFHGAYGRRLGMEYNGKGWVEQIIDELKRAPESRRAVATIWDNLQDWSMIQTGRAKDIPCNDLIKVDIRDGKVNLFVIARSNDAIWGAYGSNAVMFSMLLQYIANRLQLPVGFYEQISLDFHEYVAVADKTPVPEGVGPFNECVNPYVGALCVVPFGDPTEWQHDLSVFFNAVDMGRDPLPLLQSSWWCRVASPMWAAWTALRGRPGATIPGEATPDNKVLARRILSEAEQRAGTYPVPDWIAAGKLWMSV